MRISAALLCLALSVSATAGDHNTANYVSFLVARSPSLDKDSCIYQAYEDFVGEDAQAISLPDAYIHLETYDSLITLDEDATTLGTTMKKVRNATATAKSILGYNVSSEAEKHDMALIQPAAEMYFEEHDITALLDSTLRSKGDSGQTQNAFVVVSLLKVYPNADLIADINRTAKLTAVFTGGLSFATSAIVKKALKATAGKGYSVIASNLFYKLDRESMTLTHVGKTNNYGIVNNLTQKELTEMLQAATRKALSNTQEEIFRDYAKDKSESKGLIKNLKKVAHL